MIRHCDGKDPYLVRSVDSDDLYTYVPCDCGLTFDDVKRMVVYPHEKV